MASLPQGTFSTEIFRPFQEGKIFTLALVWTLYATCAFLFGAWRSSRAWRWGGLLLLALTTPLVFANLSYYDASWHALVFNRTLAAFAIFIAALWLIVRTYARSGEAFEEAPRVRPIATVAANLLAIVALSAQAAGYYEAKIVEELNHAGAAASGSNGFESQRNLELAKQLSLSVVWALYASGLLVAGRVRRLRLLRVMGLGATFIDNAQGVFSGLVIARTRLPDYLIHHARSDPARRFLLLPAQPAAKRNGERRPPLPAAQDSRPRKTRMRSSSASSSRLKARSRGCDST